MLSSLVVSVLKSCISNEKHEKLYIYKFHEIAIFFNTILTFLSVKSYSKRQLSTRFIIVVG